MRALQIVICLQYFLNIQLYAQATETKLRLQDIQCQGNVVLSCEDLKSRMFLQIGEPLDEIEIQNAKLRMHSFPELQSAEISLEKGNSPEQAIVVIRVIESNYWSKRLSAGLISRGTNHFERITGEVQYNNFLNSGKILSLNVDQKHSLSTQTPHVWYSRIQYTDPHIFGSQRWFLTGGLSYLQNEIRGTDSDGDQLHFQSEKLFNDVKIGYRVSQSSFVSLGIFDTPINHLQSHWTYFSDSSQSHQSEAPSFRQGVSFAYGWNTEDDADFTTRGSQFIASLSLYRPETNSFGTFYGASGGLFYKKTWTSDSKNIWSFKVGIPNQFQQTAPLAEDIGLSLTYARDAKGFKSALFGDVTQTRKYVEAGYFLGSVKEMWVPGVKAGYMMQTQHLGVINFYLFGLEENRGFNYR